MLAIPAILFVALAAIFVFATIDPATMDARHDAYRCGYWDGRNGTTIGAYDPAHSEAYAAGRADGLKAWLRSLKGL